MIEKRTKSFIIRVLRRASLKWYARTQVLKAAFIRQEGKKHIVRCAECQNEFTRKEVQVDHIQPVVDPDEDGFTIDQYCERLFCSPEGLQVLCILCHQNKTYLENQLRPLTKEKKPRKVKKKKVTNGRI